MKARDIIKAAATLANCSVSDVVGPTRVAAIARYLGEDPKDLATELDSARVKNRRAA